MCEHDWFKHKTEPIYQCWECGAYTTFESLVLSKLNSIITLLRKE